MDKALKQRLVGAVVLIALAVIVLPMIFGGRPASSGPEARSIELPEPPPDLDFEIRRFPVADEAALGAGPARASGDDGEGAEAVPSLPEPDPFALGKAAGSEAASGDSGHAEVPVDDLPQAASEAPPAASMETLLAGLMAAEEADPALRYVVQVASFGNAENAVRLAGRLEDAGYAVLLDHVSSESGQLNRVRVGPYATEGEAQDTAGALRERFSEVNPRIVDLLPDETGPALAGEDPLMRWVVQLGSFSSQENARQLVSRLRASGLTAYDETVSSGTSTIYRVRVGPYLDRAQALSAEQRIGADTGIDGVVMSAD